jgi:hypothetical protein
MYGTDRTIVKAVISIATSTTISGEVNVNAKRIVGIQMPAAWTVGNITLQALLDEPAALPKVPVWGVVSDGAGAAIVFAATPAAGTYIALPDTLALKGLGRIRLVTTGVQVADRTIGLVCVDV